MLLQSLQPTTKTKLTDVDILYDGMIISNELIVQKYQEFLLENLKGEEQSVSVAFHTGSQIFEMVVSLLEGLACLYRGNDNPATIVDDLHDGDMVEYKGKRFIWRGVEEINGQKYFTIERSGTGNHGPIINSHNLASNISHLKPYRGDAKTTGRRGMSTSDAGRIDFLSSLLGIPEHEIASQSRSSIVLVMPYNIFRPIAEKLSISYNGTSEIEFLQLFTASFYNDGLDERRYRNNSGHLEPDIKVAGSLAVARDLIYDRYSDKNIEGLIVFGDNAIGNGYTELSNLIDGKRLKFIHISTALGSPYTKALIKPPEINIFACTKEYLSNKISIPANDNQLTRELWRQAESIASNTSRKILLDNGLPNDLYQNVIDSLNAIRHSDWDEDYKEPFITQSLSLLKLFSTAIFPLKVLEESILAGNIHSAVQSPKKRLDGLLDLSLVSGRLEESCIDIVSALEKLYYEFYESNPKLQALSEYVEDNPSCQILVVVPKNYYVTVIETYHLVQTGNLTISTPKRRWDLDIIDSVLVVGSFFHDWFEPTQIRGKDSIILLYDYEQSKYRKKAEIAGALEAELNIRQSSGATFQHEVETSIEDGDVDDNEYELSDEIDLDDYLKQIRRSDLSRALRKESVAGASQTADIHTIGYFEEGYSAMFTEHYEALVFNSETKKVHEINPLELSIGDHLIFLKRDGSTTDAVDFIFQHFLESGVFNEGMHSAYKKSKHWKEVLKSHQTKYGLNYNELLNALQKHGSTLHVATIRQWLAEDSNTVGPQDRNTLQYIGELTRDSALSEETNAYYEACVNVRRSRRRIRNLLGNFISEALSGLMPAEDSPFRTLANNIDDLFIILELEDIETVKPPLSAPYWLTNKPVLTSEGKLR